MNADGAGRPAVFLDRDGTLNVEKNYLYRIEDWEWIPGCVEAIAELNAAGVPVIVVTNQAGIARGLYTEADLFRLHEFVGSELARAGARVDGFYHCPHHPDFGDRLDCDCRKPRPGMLRRAADEHGIDLTRSWVIGDRETDVEAALACGARPVLVETGYGARTRALLTRPVEQFPSAAQAISGILNRLRDTPAS